MWRLNIGGNRSSVARLSRWLAAMKRVTRDMTFGRDLSRVAYGIAVRRNPIPTKFGLLQ